MSTDRIPALLEPIQNRLAQATHEQWRPWPTNPDYEVSDHGNVRSWMRRGRETADPTSPRLLKPRFRKDKKYASLSLRHPDGRTASRSIHSVVMEAWVGPRPEGEEVAHLNGNPSDNRLENLQYVTHVVNESHKALHGTRATGESVNGAVLAEWQVAEIRYLDSRGVGHVKIGELFGVGHKYVSEIAAGQTWTHVDPRKDAEEAARLLAAVQAVELTAKYLDKLADGDRHYANLFRKAVIEALGGKP